MRSEARRGKFSDNQMVRRGEGEGEGGEDGEAGAGDQVVLNKRL